MCQTRVKRVSQPIAQEIEGKYRERNGNPWKENKMRSCKYLVAFRTQHGAPFRGRRLRAQPQEGKCRRIENGGSDPKRALHDQRSQRVGENPFEEDFIGIST